MNTPTTEVLTLPINGKVAKIEIDLMKYTALGLEAETIANKMDVLDDDGESKAADVLSAIIGHKKTVEAARVENVDPFNQFVKRVNSMFKPLTTALENAELTIKTKVLGYRKEKQARIDAENRKAQAEFEKSQKAAEKKAEKTGKDVAFVPPPVIQEVSTTTRGASGGAITEKKFWTAQITDPKKVPIEYYLAPNVQEELLKNMKALSRSTKGSVPVGGVKFYEDSSLASGR